MYAKIFSAQSSAIKAELVELELSLKEKGIHQISMVGLPDKAVEEAKDRVSAALDNLNFEKGDNFKTLKSYRGKVTVSLSPAELKKSGSLYDLPIALAYLKAVGEIDYLPEDTIFVGELALDASIKAVKGLISIAILAKRAGFKRIVAPKANSFEVLAVDGIRLSSYDNLAELISDLKSQSLKEYGTKSYTGNIKKHIPKYILDDIKGQELAKRALTVAAAGGHNIALYGPPGTGKSMLAKVFSELLPNLSKEDSLEVSQIYSIKGLLKDSLLKRPPLRSPHHSASHVAVLGGGAQVAPGEISLAHKGVLFLDEFPEFDKRVINALREPLEERKISIARAGSSETFPADFVLVVALNPCPCGYYGTNKCTCTASAIQRYQNKISGPIADRIDIWVEVNQVEYSKLLDNKKREAKEHNRALLHVKRARKAQQQRFGADRLNSQMSPAALNKFVSLSDSVKSLLDGAAEKMGLSARAYHKIIKLARTIADMEGEKDLKEKHLLEALNYREKMLK